MFLALLSGVALGTSEAHPSRKHFAQIPEHLKLSKNVNKTWKFLSSYPTHLLVLPAAKGEVTIDGILDEKAWESADWHRHDFVDITVHQNVSLNGKVPGYQQAEVAVLWDESYLYVGARLREPVVYGTVQPAHNGPKVPYTDNDFEVFLDPSMTTQFYKEFEMNVLNATYDVNWGVPDGPFYSGSWSMYQNDTNTGAVTTGLRVATHTFSKLGSPVPNSTGMWTLEIAFPIKNNSAALSRKNDRSNQSNHGGLLDTDSSGTYDYSRFDPGLGDPIPGFPRFWAVDFARTVHPRKYFTDNKSSNGDSARDSFYWCPFFNCSESVIERSVSATLDKPNATDCAKLASQDQTILGPNAYMHRPLHFPMLQFVQPQHTSQHSREDQSAKVVPICGNVEFPARHLLLTIFMAQRNFKSATGTYARTIPELLKNASTCAPPACAGDDLLFALNTPDIFRFDDIAVIANATELTATCSARPCFHAKMSVTVPPAVAEISSISGDSSSAVAAPSHVMIGSIDQNERLGIEHVVTGEGSVSCLF